MKLILANMCKSLSGTIYPGTGYHLEHRKNCNRRKATYNAQDVLNLKVTFGL